MDQLLAPIRRNGVPTLVAGPVRGNNAVWPRVLLGPRGFETHMLRNRLLLILLPIVVAVGFAACDNIGRAFDPNLNPNEPGTETGTSSIQIVPFGGDAREGRPVVRETYPSGDGWPSTVPIVIEFSESINEATILPTSPTASDARIGVRIQGTEQLLPAQYEFLAQGRLLVIRPISGLASQGNAIYEVVLFPEGRDVDGVRFQVSGGEKILSDFQVNQDESITDGSIVAVYPRDNFSQATRESDFFVVFDRPANAATLLENDIFLRPQGGVAIDVAIDVPLTTVGVGDPRVVRLRPDATLQIAQQYEFFATSNITFGQDGNLDVNSNVPVSRFTTIGPSEPTLIELGNAGDFPNKVNLANALNVMLNVTTSADTAAGDLIVARIYGRDETTSQTFDLTFVERTAQAPAAGVQTVMLDFGGQLGTLQAPRFTEGDITFAAQIRRGQEATGFIHNDSDDEPIFDITPPTLTQAGPPGDGTDIFTEGESLAYYGVASEALAEASLADGVNPMATMFGSSKSGRFLMQPVPLGLLGAPRNYTLTLTDAAGNLSETAVAGSITQRGYAIGTLGATLTVEAYDQTTLLPIAGATVLVDPATPTVPATAQLMKTTDPGGRVVFTTGLGSSNTITIIRAGFDLVTLYDTQSAQVSLPLNPVAARTATLAGNAVLQAAPGTTVIIGSTELADNSPMGVRTTTAAPTTIPATEIVPNRAQIITAFGGSFEPTAMPTFSSQGCEVCGVTLVSPTAPVAPPAVGETASSNVVLSPAPTPLAGLVGPATEDFGLALGLDLTDLVDDSPRSRVTSSLAGFTNQVLTGIGAVTLQAGMVYEVNANYSLPIIVGLDDFSPAFWTWLVTEAEDTSGRVSRVRALLNLVSGTIALPSAGPSAIPEITEPAVTFDGSPLVSYADTLDAVTVTFGFGVAFFDVTATDSAGRRWLVIRPDRDGTGADSLQFPDLAAHNVAGLSTGSWEVIVEGRIALPVTGNAVDDFILTERFRQEVNYVRSAPETFTIN